MKGTGQWSFVPVLLLCFLNVSLSDSFPKAQNVTWVSFNFKTLLTWTPKPTNYSYTVEYSKLGEDNQRASHCIQTTETVCDLTAVLTELKSKYSADVLSEALKGMSSDLIEFPRTASELFCPYQDTIIGSPTFNFEMRNEERKIILNIEDILTAVFDEQKRQLTVQDIFKNDLRYQVTYSKAKSSGKKLKISTSRKIELTDLDRGESYCFSVQVYLPSRSINKYGELSQVQCSSEVDPSILNDSFPKAQNVTWVSFNFKTLLTWTPKPTNYSYTVEYSKLGEDNQRASHCIQTTETVCDLTAVLTELKSKYSADVLSEALKGMSSDLIEFPRTASELFCPYQDTIIGSPTFNFEMRNEERKIILNIEDILTAVFDEQKRQLTVQDIFKNDLRYQVTYSKAKSSGKKLKISEDASRKIELTDLDRGESYCFSVQVYLPSRSINKYGELSQVQCSSEVDPSILNDYSPAVIGGGILFIIAIISAVIAAIVICSKQRREAKTRGKEGVPLKGV
ncbi:coagulation factor IIIa [Tachysurus fulvidraco]|uniref:coagulation factor IIIa n=1 Tax=Tachysurus fulvidraco TaxID=1234273 RepID=UPI001FEE4E1D|nr:coagulation factor IIIa [Tachysurus fulvidraco]